MSYSTEVAKDAVERDMLVVIKPRIRLESLALYSGSVYSQSFSYGYISGVKVNGTALTEAASSSLSAGQYYFDHESGTVFIRKSDSTAPSGTDWVVATFELFVSTKEFYWYRDPLDTSSESVLFRGLIKEAPTIARSCTETIFGFSPVESTQVSCAFEAEYFEEFLYDASFNEAETIIYHRAGKLDSANISKIHTGICRNLVGDDKSVSFQIVDKLYGFDSKVTWAGTSTNLGPARDQDGTSFDPKYAYKYVPTRFGMHADRAMCSTYNTDSPATTDNRVWTLMSNVLFTPWTASVTQTFGASTPLEFSPEDYQRIRGLYFMGAGKIKWSGGTATRNLTAVTDNLYRANFSGVFPIPGIGTTVEPWMIQRLWLIKTDTTPPTWYELTRGTHYNEGATGHGFGFTLVNNFESSFGLSAINPETDYFFAEFIGSLMASSYGGSVFGSTADPYSLLHFFLISIMGLGSSEVDESKIFEVYEETKDLIPLVSFSVPESWDASDMPTYKDVIQKLLVAGLLIAYIDKDGKFTVERIKPTSTPILTLTDDDIAEYSFEVLYDDMATVRAVYHGEVLGRTKADILSSATQGVATIYEYQNEVLSENSVATYLHESAKQIDVDSVVTEYVNGVNVFNLDGEQIHLNKIGQLINERRYRITVFVPTGAHEVELGQTVRLQRTRMPGFAYDGDTVFERDFIVVSVRKQINGVQLVLDDQKGIQDNSGDW